MKIAFQMIHNNIIIIINNAIITEEVATDTEKFC